MNIYDQAKQVIDMFEASEKPIINLSKLNSNQTAVIVVDMIKGFAKAGVLFSKRIKNIIKENEEILNKLEHGHHVFLCDLHEETSSEFNVFPEHCIEGTDEVEIVNELEEFSKRGTIIQKNSTNGFIEPEFLKWLDKRLLNDIVITGCCTDLCVLQFATTLKTHFNRLNETCNIYVVLDAVETYDIDQVHPGDFMHLMALKFMQDMGIIIGRLK